MNKILKGFRPQELTVISGHTGVGKTTLLCEYSLDLAEQGVPTLWGSFEMPLRKICRTLVHQFAGFVLIYIIDISSEIIDLNRPNRIVDWAYMFGKTVPMYFMNMHGSHLEAEVFKVRKSIF